VLALTLILAVLVPDPFQGMLPAWRWWFWLVLGGLAELAIVASTLGDPEVRAKLSDERARTRLAPTTIANLDYRRAAEQALRHRTEIEVMLHRTRRREDREQMRAIVDDVTRWSARIVRFAQHLDDQQTQTATRSGPDPVDGAESKLYESLRALETTYARLQLVAAEGFNARRIEQLRGEIAEQIRVLQETMESLS
jgi:hypothetical protein